MSHSRRLYLLFAALTLPAYSQGPLTNTNVATGAGGSNAMVKLDCNNDGVMDLVTTNRDKSISVFVGNADGTYQAPQTQSLASSGQPTDIFYGDMDNDGNIDLVIAASPNVLIMRGNGKCAFAAVSPIISVPAPYWVAVADVNGDGKPDVVVSSLAANNINVLLGNGSGGFGAPIGSTVGPFPYNFTVVDLNGDGKPDIAATDLNGGGIWVAQGDGAGKFIQPMFLATGQNPQPPAVGDINGDGKPDLAVSNGGSDTVLLMLNSTVTIGGQIGFGPPLTIQLPANTGPASPVLTNSPGGDKQDLVLIPGFSNSIMFALANLNYYIELWLGGWPFNPPRKTYSVGLDPVSVATVPGGGAALPGANGVSFLKPNCSISVSPAGFIAFGLNRSALALNPGQDVAITVPDGCFWRASTPADYVTITPSFGEGSKTVNVAMTPNPGPAVRSTTLFFSSGGDVDTLSAHQLGDNTACADPTVDKTALNVPAAGGTVSVTATIGGQPSDQCGAGTGTTYPSIMVTPAGGVTATGPVTFTAQPNQGDTFTSYGLVGPNVISITEEGGCIPVLGSFNGTVPANGAMFVVPYTTQAGCAITPSAAGLSATLIQLPGQSATVGGAAAVTSTSWNVQVTVPASSASGPLTGTVTIGSQTAHFVQKPPAPTQLFDDVPLTHPFVDWITMLKKLGVTSGCSATSYCPDNPVTRGQMAVFIVRSVESGDNFPYTTTPYFQDVPASNSFFKYIQRLKDLGITAGCGGANYCPNDPVTRGQMGVFMIRGRMGVMAGIPIPYTGDQYFTDEPVTDGFYPFVQQMKALGITSGCSATAYCPGASVTRAQMAVFLVRAFFTPFVN